MEIFLKIVIGFIVLGCIIFWIWKNPTRVLGLWNTILLYIKKFWIWILIGIAVFWLFGKIQGCFTTTPQEAYLESLPKGAKYAVFTSDSVAMVPVPIGKTIKYEATPFTVFPFNATSARTGETRSHASAVEPYYGFSGENNSLFIFSTPMDSSTVAYWFE